MLFNSYVFLFVFLPLALCGYYLAARLSGAPAARVWLCIASFVFYGWWNPVFALLLLTSIGFNYLLSHYLVGDEGPKYQGWILFAGVGANLLLLFYFKYLFALLRFLHELGWMRVDAGTALLPIGISFFTFTQIGYLVDCRQGQVRERGWVNYVLFVTFFPHLIAGPILHHREIMPQFARDDTYRLRARNIAIGLTLFSVGLAKKVLLADSIAMWVERGFGALTQLTALSAWSVVLGYSMQLYFDFSGYCDMAIGLGILFGIRLPLNFNSPYQSLSIIDFWQRWHITLTRYLTLLLYNPLAVWIARRRQRAGLPLNRRAAATPGGFLGLIVLPTFATVLVAGVWHGAGLTFVLYGALHGVYLSANHAWRTFHRPYAMPASLSWSAVYAIAWRVALTYMAVLLAQIVFRVPSIADALSVLAALAGLHGVGLPFAGNFLPHTLFILALMVLAFGFPNVYQFLGEYSPALSAVKPMKWPGLTWRPDWRVATAVGVLLAVTALCSQRSVQFLYFQF
jgi:alginate O-acetyltransferase complex protein AlgI